MSIAKIFLATLLVAPSVASLRSSERERAGGLALRGRRSLQDDLCVNGIQGFDGSNENGDVCCPLGCNQCGGDGCAKSGRSNGLSNKDCCINGILGSKPDCSDSNSAPCVVTDGGGPTPTPPTPTPPTGDTCSNGLSGIDGSNDSGEVCCPLGCNQCGGDGCAKSGKSNGLTNKDCCINGILNNKPDCSATSSAPCVITDGGPSPSPPSPSPPSPGPSGGDACDPNPCQNGGSCALDPGGGRICTCASGYGGMSCQTDTSGLNEFSINLTFTKANNVPSSDDWTEDDKEDMRRFAARWENVITHVPCGDGVLEMEIEWVKSFQVNPPTVRPGCPADKQISISGHLQNSRGLQKWKESDNVWEAFVTHEMGHAVGIGYLWGKCTDCIINGTPPLDAKWDADACPSVYNTWLDLADKPYGTEADIIETDVSGTTGECVHWDFDAIPAELNTKGTFHRENPGGEVFMSKLTLAALEDIGYIVDPSKADPFSLP